MVIWKFLLANGASEKNGNILHMCNFYLCCGRLRGFYKKPCPNYTVVDCMNYVSPF